MNAVPSASATKAARRAAAASPAPRSAATRTVAAWRDPQRHHEGDAGVVDRDLVRGERVGAEQPDHRRRRRQRPRSPAPAARRSAPPSRRMRRISPAYLVQLAAQPRRRSPRRSSPHHASHAEHHQPLHDRRGIGGADQAQRRRAEMAEDQHPVKPGIGGHAQRQDDHHRARPLQRAREDCAIPRIRETPVRPSKSRAGNGRSRATTPGRTHQVEQPTRDHHRRDHRHREQRGERPARCPAMRPAPARSPAPIA